MSKFNLVADVSAYQPSDLGFFKRLKRHGVKAVIIKLTEGSKPGTAYVNSKFDLQAYNAKKAGLQVHAYHYARFTSSADAVNEARWFVKNLEKHRVSQNSVAVIDVEDSGIPKYCLNEGIHKFLYYLAEHGYQRGDVYCMASWIWSHFISGIFLRNHNMWVARYGHVAQPGVAHVGTWQYTDNFAGMNVDMSYDFKGYYTGKEPEPYVPKQTRKRKSKGQAA